MKHLAFLICFGFAGTLLAADVSGTYSGKIVAESPNGTRERDGLIILKQDGDKLTVTAGQSAHEQFPGTKVELRGESLKFELAMPGDAEMVVRFDLTLKDGKMTGGLVHTRDGQSMKGTLAFTRQP